MLQVMEEETDKRQYVTAIYMRPSLWKRVRTLALKRDLKLWQAIDEGMEAWVKTGERRRDRATGAV